MEYGPFTQEQFWKLCDAGTYLPVPLSAAAVDDQNPSFVYDREWGVFHVPSGLHYQVMALLQAFREGHLTVDTMERNAAFKAADRYLRLNPGCGFVSSVAPNRFITFAHNLNGQEKMVFRRFEIFYMEDELNNPSKFE